MRYKEHADKRRVQESKVNGEVIQRKAAEILIKTRTAIKHAQIVIDNLNRKELGDMQRHVRKTGVRSTKSS